MNDNTSALSSTDYDSKIAVDIPYYNEIQKEVINIAKSFSGHYSSWLDTGCGTGNLALKILENKLSDKLILADPSEKMLNTAKSKLNNNDVEFILSKTQELKLKPECMDIVTAIQCHHYETIEGRKKAVKKCYDILKNNCVFITSENYRPDTKKGLDILLEYWKHFQVENGKTEEASAKHVKRFDTEFFPITINEHLELFKEAGFRGIELLWKSYMQVAFIMIK